MSTTEVLGLGLIGLGGVFAYFHDTFSGMLFASVCLILGLAMTVASEAQGLISKPRGAHSNSRGQKQARVVVLVKGEVHVYPQPDGRFQEIHDANQTEPQFDVFMNCWWLLATEMKLRITDVGLTLKGADGVTRVGERVMEDLKNWQLRKGEENEEESDWPEVNIRKAPAGLPELDAAAPLECGAPREGWLHFRIRNTTPSALKNGSLELCIKDFLSDTHSAVAGRVLLPGNVCPIPATSPIALDARKEDEPPSHDERLAS